MACTGMLSYEDDALKFSKNCENHKQHVHHMHHSSGARGTVFLSANQYGRDQKHER